MPRLVPPQRPVTIDLDGEPIAAEEGEPAACSLLAAGESLFSRSVKYHRPRGPFCFSGACSNCLMRVDGTPNVFTCRTPVRSGMRLERQNVFPSARLDLFSATDWLFPGGLDHHEMLAGVPVASAVMAKVARHLAGLGLLPSGQPPERLPAVELDTAIAVVGGGVSGQAAAETLGTLGVPFLLLERDAELGGRYLSGPVAGPSRPGAALPTGSARTHTTTVGLFEDDRGRFLAAVDHREPRFLTVRARGFLLAVGGHPTTLAFENNDLPGIFAATAVSALLRRHKVRPGASLAILGTGPEADGLAALWTQAGGRVVATVDLASSPPVAAHGHRHLTGLTLRDASGRKSKLECDTLALSLPLSPGFELARQAGAEVGFDASAGHFAVRATEEGATSVPGLWVAGQLAGARTLEASRESGQRAAAAAASRIGAGR